MDTTSPRCRSLAKACLPRRVPENQLPRAGLSMSRQNAPVSIGPDRRTVESVAPGDAAAVGRRVVRPASYRVGPTRSTRSRDNRRTVGQGRRHRRRRQPRLRRRQEDQWQKATYRGVRDYERRSDHHEAMVLWATVAIMTRNLQQATSGPLPCPRRGRPRTGPPVPIKQAA